MYARFHKNLLWKLVVDFTLVTLKSKIIPERRQLFFSRKISQSTSSRHISDAITKEEEILHMLKEQELEAVKNAREEIVSQRT